jgi:hypothetical protein
MRRVTTLGKRFPARSFAISVVPEVETNVNPSGQVEVWAGQTRVCSAGPWGEGESLDLKA